jgi:glycosyltransferase involved in cell wall biosynthesis
MPIPLPSRKRIAVIHSQLLCVDGVSLEAEKWIKAYATLGHKVFLVAGKFGSEPKLPFKVIPELALDHPTVESIKRMAFETPLGESENRALRDLIASTVRKIKPELLDFIHRNGINLLSIENVLAIPANIPLGIALKEIIEELNIPTIMRHHDFFWERSYFIKYNNIPDILGKAFPPKLDRIKNVTISRVAQQDFLRWTGVDSTVIENAVDFAMLAKADRYNRDFRKAFNIRKDQLLFLQPTRILERKRIERSIELAAKVNRAYRQKDKCVLLVTGPTSGPESKEYFEFIVKKARDLDVDVVFASDRIYLHRTKSGGKKVYSIDDAYANADLVCFPSEIEGFGNVVIEAAAYKKPLFVNDYPVLKEIKNRGFDFIEMDQVLTKEVVKKTIAILRGKKKRDAMVKKNFKIAREHYSLEALESRLRNLITEADRWTLERLLSEISSAIYRLTQGIMALVFFKRVR